MCYNEKNVIELHQEGVITVTGKNYLAPRGKINPSIL